MRKIINKLVFIFCFLLIIFMVFNRTTGAQQPGKTDLKEMIGVEIKKVSEDKTDIVIKTTGLVKYRCFKLATPPKLVIDMTGVKHSWAQKNINGGNPLVKKVRTSQFQDEPEKIVRIVVDLHKEISYEAISMSDNVTITLQAAKAKEEKKAVEAKKTPVEKPKAVAEKKAVSKPAKKIKKAKKKIQRPVVSKPGRTNKNTEDIEHRRLVEKIRRQEEKIAAKKKKTGASSVMEGVIPAISDEMVSLNFYQADITEVFRVLAEQSGMNFIFGDDVTGKITIYLNDVSFDDAFRSILKLNGLVAQKQADNIIRIVSPEKLKMERGKAVKITRKFGLKYTTADDIQKQFSGVEFGGVIATVRTDKTTNSLIITSTPEGLEEYEQIIEVLDIMPRQVLIEARIMEMAIDNVPIDMGVDWSVARDFNDRNRIGDRSDNMITLGRTSNADGSTQYEGFPDNSESIVHPSAGGSGVNMLNYIPTTGGLLRLGSVLNKTRFNLTLAALSQTEKLNELSHPRIITLNNEEATILVGDKIPVKEKTVEDGAITESTIYIDTGIKLSVTPTINEDGYITLVIHPEISSYSPEGDSYVISSREATTKVLIKDGDTIVIAGLIQDKEVTSVNKVPILGDIPILGVLFKHVRKTVERTELIVFVTATIVEQMEE